MRPSCDSCCTRHVELLPAKTMTPKDRAAEELKLSYCEKDTVLFTICPYYGNLLLNSLTATQKVQGLPSGRRCYAPLFWTLGILTGERRAMRWAQIMLRMSRMPNIDMRQYHASCNPECYHALEIRGNARDEDF